MTIKGVVHKFGDDINTDDIIAAKYLDSYDETFLGSKCMENITPAFVQKVHKGDIIVAGKNFGCGSSREHAAVSIKGAGIALVIATSFARIFYRNCINRGLPILICPQSDQINGGDELMVDLKKGLIKDLNTNKMFYSQKFPLFMQEIIQAGGLLRWLQEQES